MEGAAGTGPSRGLGRGLCRLSFDAGFLSFPGRGFCLFSLFLRRRRFALLFGRYWRRRFCPLLAFTLLDENHEHFPDADHLPGFYPYFLNDSGNRRGDLCGRFVCLDDQYRLSVFDSVPDVNENFDYLTFVDSFSQIGQLELDRHTILQS